MPRTVSKRERSLGLLVVALVGIYAIFLSWSPFRRRCHGTHTELQRVGSSSSKAQPSVAVYTINTLNGPLENEGGVTIHGGYWWAEFLLVSRLYNPRLPIVAMVDRLEAVQAHPRVGPALRAANISLAALQEYSRPGSRGHRLMAEAGRFYQRYFQAFIPGHMCADEGSVGSAHCELVSKGRMKWLARFCWQADLAAAQRPDYVVTMDADAMLTDDFMATLGWRMVDADVLTFTEWSSQVVVWRRAALDAFCEATVSLLDMGPQDAWYVFHAGRGQMTEQEWTDMHMLSAFLRVMRPDLPRVVLCGTPADLGWELCRSLVWKLAHGASYLPARDDGDREHVDDCSQMGEYVEWRRNATAAPAAGGNTEHALPELWTRAAFLDLPDRSQAGAGSLQRRMHGPGQRAPLVHWQGACKEAGSRHVREQYVAAGLLPQLAPSLEF